MFEIIYPDKKIEKISLEDICKWEKTILYFYPKDNTPGCTKEAKDFSNLLEEFQKLWYQIVWVSKDSISSHEKFIEKQSLNIPLISDPDLILHNKFWVWGEKNNYGKKTMWTIRSTFILDENCNIIKEYRNVKATWHAERVLKDLQS
jgi:peroxiredoxin Q/BCP